MAESGRFFSGLPERKIGRRVVLGAAFAVGTESTAQRIGTAFNAAADIFDTVRNSDLHDVRYLSVMLPGHHEQGFDKGFEELTNSEAVEFFGKSIDKQILVRQKDGKYIIDLKKDQPVIVTLTGVSDPNISVRTPVLKTDFANIIVPVVQSDRLFSTDVPLGWHTADEKQISFSVTERPRDGKEFRPVVVSAHYYEGQPVLENDFGVFIGVRQDNEEWARWTHNMPVETRMYVKRNGERYLIEHALFLTEEDSGTSSEKRLVQFGSPRDVNPAIKSIYHSDGTLDEGQRYYQGPIDRYQKFTGAEWFRMPILRIGTLNNDMNQNTNAPYYFSLLANPKGLSMSDTREHDRVLKVLSVREAISLHRIQPNDPRIGTDYLKGR